MPGKKSHRKSIRKQRWRIGVRIMPPILLVAVLRSAAKLYIVREFLAVLFLVAVSTGTILVLAVAFLLFQEGIQRTVQWTKIGLVRPTHLGPQEQ
jgi:uncharacterized membrane protein